MWTEEDNRAIPGDSPAVGDGAKAALAAGEAARERPAGDAAEEALEARLREFQKMESVGMLTRGVAHKINNLLLPITMLTEITMRRLPADDQALRRLRTVLAAAQQIAAIVSQVLSFSRAEAPVRGVFDLHAAVAETVSLLRASVPSSVVITLSDGHDAEPIELLADRSQIQQMVVNLATNAAQASDGPRRNVAVSSGLAELGAPLGGRLARLGPGRYAHLSVADDGLEIPEDAGPAIFDPFLATRWVGIGSGLGLAVAEGIVANHDGAIEARSRPGGGTIFDVYLPLPGFIQRGNGKA